MSKCLRITSSTALTLGTLTTSTLTRVGAGTMNVSPVGACGALWICWIVDGGPRVMSLPVKFQSAAIFLSVV
jgi:hypothetical protein